MGVFDFFFEQLFGFNYRTQAGVCVYGELFGTIYRVYAIKPDPDLPRSRPKKSTSEPVLFPNIFLTESKLPALSYIQNRLRSLRLRCKRTYSRAFQDMINLCQLLQSETLHSP